MVLLKQYGRGLWIAAAVTIVLTGVNLAADSPNAAALKNARVDVRPLKGGGTVVSANAPQLLSNDVWKIISAHLKVKEFYSAGKAFDDTQIKNLSAVASVESINFRSCGVTDAGLEHLGRLPHLKRLALESMDFSGSGLAPLKDAKSLESLTIRGNNGFRDTGMDAIGELTQLKELHATVCGMTSKGFPNLAKLTNLESLSLDPNFSPSFTGNDFVHLEGLSNLRELSLANMVLPYDDGLSHLKGLPLKTLTLFDCWITAPDFEKLQADLPKAKIIRKFSIDENAKTWRMYAAKRKKPAKK